MYKNRDLSVLTVDKHIEYISLASDMLIKSLNFFLSGHGNESYNVIDS